VFDTEKPEFDENNESFNLLWRRKLRQTDNPIFIFCVSKCADRSYDAADRHANPVTNLANHNNGRVRAGT